MNVQVFVNVRSNRDFLGKNEEEIKIKNFVFYKGMIIRFNQFEKFFFFEKINILLVFFVSWDQELGLR